MAGVKGGGLKSRDTNYARHGKDFYRNIGKLGGSVKGVKKGFAADPERARIAGAKGGRTSRRGRAKREETDE